MKAGIWVVALATVMMLTVAVAETAHAQYAENVEIAVLGTVSITSPERGDDETAIAIPGGSSVLPTFAGLRLAFHNASPYLLEVGGSLLNVEDVTILNLEGAVGGEFGHREDKSMPFVQGIIGMLHVSNGTGETELYLGAQGGFRYFFKPNAVTRFQVGYRKMLGDEFNFSILEFGIGIGILI